MRASSLTPNEACNLPSPRDGLRRGAPCLQVGWGGPWGGALTEVWRHVKPASVGPDDVVRPGVGVGLVTHDQVVGLSIRVEWQSRVVE